MKCGRKLSLICLVLLLASSSLWAFPGRGEEKETLTEAPSIVMTEELTKEAELPSNTSGIVLETISPEQKSLQKNSLEKAVEIADSHSLIIGSKYDELIFNLNEAQKDKEAIEKSSAAKDSEIADLKEALAEAESETGTKAYMMMEGIIGFNQIIPTYGAGLTLGMRLGNHMMVELGADYTIGSFTDKMFDFSLDNFEFRAGIGWMF